MMKVALALAVVCLTHSVEAKADGKTGGECLACHMSTDEAYWQSWDQDVHARAGVTCQTCHGGDATQKDKALAKRPGSRYRGELSPQQIVSLCGGCHGDAEYMKAQNPLLPVDQWEKYRTSVHGKLLAQGETKVANCASCHGAHGILPVNDAKSPVYAANVATTCAHCHADAEYMSDFGIPTDQYENYVQSVHGKALLEKNDVRGAPTCNDCHGNHGAAPPAVDEVSNICGTCHSHNAELFLESPLARGFREKSLADCIACHGKHLIIHVSDDWLGDKPGTVCHKCHEPGDEGSQLAVYFAQSIGEARQSSSEIEQLLKKAERKGMDVAEGEDHLEEARQGLMQARTLIHSFSQPVVDEKLDEVTASQEAAMEAAYTALEDFETRRRGLAISTLLLLLLTMGVGIKIRMLPPS
jgi:hypothetical protein